MSIRARGAASGLAGGVAGVQVTGRLRDISATGLCVALGLEVAAAAFSEADRVEVSFCLPPRSTPVRLLASIRHGRIEDERLLYGLEFEPEHSEHFDLQQGEIADCVTRRLQEELEKGDPAA